jgi:hypothetical protein
MKQDQFPGPKQEYKLSEEAEREVAAKVEAEARAIGDQIRGIGRSQEFEPQMREYPGGRPAFSGAFDRVAAVIESAVIEASKAPGHRVAIERPAELVTLYNNLQDNSAIGSGHPIARAMDVLYGRGGIAWYPDQPKMTVEVSRFVEDITRNTLNTNPDNAEVGRQQRIEKMSRGLDSMQKEGGNFAELATLLRAQLESLSEGGSLQLSVPTPDFFYGDLDEDARQRFAQRTSELGVRIFSVKGGRSLTATLGEWPAL